ncbi:MAG: hypothetical protein JW751_25845 [Polyangiaceae bacterium]|nr:hypothetical protein [Polyangiaceae bacterium]
MKRMMLHLLCLNVRRTFGDALGRALSGTAHRLSYLHTHDDDPMSSPESRPRLPPVSATLAGYLKARVPSFILEDPLVLVARGAGVERVATWLATEEARELVSALVLLEHAAGDAHSTNADALAGVLEFARDAVADPGEKLLVALSIGDPSGPTTLADGLRAALHEDGNWAHGPQPHLHIRTLPPEASGASETEGEQDETASTLLRALEQELLPFLRDLGPASAPDETLAR